MVCRCQFFQSEQTPQQVWQEPNTQKLEIYSIYNRRSSLTNYSNQNKCSIWSSKFGLWIVTIEAGHKIPAGNLRPNEI